MKKKFVKKFLCLLVALALCFGDFVPLIGYMDTAFAATPDKVQTVLAKQSDAEIEQTSPKATVPSEQSEGVIRPEDIDEGLSVNSLEDIRGRRLTVRQPIMEILEDNIVRQPAQVMSNEYVMLNFQTGNPLHDLAKINFASNSALQPGNKDHPMYPMKGLERSPKDSDGNVTEQKYFSEFTKYMLLRQAYYFNTHVTDIINNNQLKKHPAADYIYGKIPDDAKAVKMRIVTDPIYRSPMTTGLYLVPGETATVKIKGLKAGETVTLYTHHQDTMGYLGYDEDGHGFGKMEDYLAYWDKKIVEEAERAEQEGAEPDFEKYKYGIHGQWNWQNQKVPCMGTTFNIVGTGQDTEVKIGSMYGGPLYVKPTSTAVDMEISGAVLTPHFVLGVTTIEEFNKQLRSAPGLIATLDVENGQLIGPAEDMRNCDDMEKLSYFWHSVFAIDISLNGRDYNYNMTMCYDMHVPAGEAVALNSNFCAQPEYWFPICMNYETLTTKGNWGTFHELGHVQAKTHGVNWGFCDGDGEVWNNTLILLIYSMLCNMDTRVISVEHGEYVHPFTAIERSQKITKQYKDKDTNEMVNITDYGMINEGNGAHFDQLSMYATLLHSFGPEKFVDMFYTYKMNPAYCSNKRADFVYRIGVVDRVNILDWVNKNYFANIKDNMFSSEQLEFLHNLPAFVPVAYQWANGIDGNETARKYDVDGKFPTVFDLGDECFSSPEKVEIVAVTGVRHGEISYDPSAKKVTYTPPATPTEYDRFDIIVKTKGGRRVTLNVNMHLVFRGLYGKVWDMGTKTNWNGHNPSIDEARAKAQNMSHSYTLTSPYAGVEFNHTNIEYLNLQLKYRVPKNGLYGFYVKADDVAEVNFRKSDLQGRLLGTVNVEHDTTNFTTYKNINVDLSAGETVFIDCHLVNWGGKGHITVGVLQPGDKEIVALPTDRIISAGVTDDELSDIDNFKGWQPRFVDSIKNATIDYTISNTDWIVLTAPESEPGSGGSNLVDGNENTIFHSKYNGNKAPLPHVFVIDTQADQTFNFFEFVRRTNGNDKLLNFELYSCTGSEYTSAGNGEDTTGWNPLFNGASANVNAARQRITFPRTQIRYFKFIVTNNNNGHTVLKEIYAGIESKLNQTVKPSNYMVKQENFTENKANGKLSAAKTGATYEFKFLGSGFELFSDTDPSYGKASVTIDDIYDGEINLGDKPLFNKQVYNKDEMKTGVHRVIVTTLDNKPFNISFINVKYGTPVTAEEYPADKDKNGGDDYGDTDVDRQFTREWKTFVKDYKTLTSIKFVKTVPQGYNDTYVRVDTYIRLYRNGDKIAFVYPGAILAPIECGSLFSGCENLSELDLDNFDTSYMRGAMNMFYDCESIQSINLSKFTTQNVLSYGKMFGNCTNLTTMDLNNFELDKDANLFRMFENCTALKTITLPKKIYGKLSCEFPYVYLDKTTHTYDYKFELSAANAGHVLELHNEHTFNGTVHDQVDPQCEIDGVVAYKTCTTCHCKFDTTTGKTLLRESDLVIPATGHDYKYEYPKSLKDFPTCTQSGALCRHYCVNCGDELAEVPMPALGHTYMLDPNFGEGKGYTIDYGSDGKATVTFHLTCQGYSDWENSTLCDHKTQVVVTFDYDTHQEVSCTEDEFFSYDSVIDKAMLIDAMVFQDAEDNVADDITSFESLTVRGTAMGLEATGHITEKVEAVPSTCLSYGSTEGTICTVCGFTENVMPTVPLGHKMEEKEALAPTCTTEGHGEGLVCTRCGEVGEGVKRIEPLGHDFSIIIDEELPTCTKVGHTDGKRCSRCDATEGCELIDDLGHEEEIIKGKAATETESGLTDGKRCSRCGEILEEQHEIPPLGSAMSGLSAVEWALVGTSIAIVTAGVAVSIVLLLRRKRRNNLKPKKK